MDKSWGFNIKSPETGHIEQQFSKNLLTHITCHTTGDDSNINLYMKTVYLPLIYSYCSVAFHTQWINNQMHAKWHVQHAVSCCYLCEMFTVWLLIFNWASSGFASWTVHCTNANICVASGENSTSKNTTEFLICSVQKCGQAAKLSEKVNC